jgi:hypothetical protein
MQTFRGIASRPILLKNFDNSALSTRKEIDVDFKNTLSILESKTDSMYQEGDELLKKIKSHPYSQKYLFLIHSHEQSISSYTTITHNRSLKPPSEQKLTEEMFSKELFSNSKMRKKVADLPEPKTGAKFGGVMGKK